MTHATQLAPSPEHLSRRTLLSILEDEREARTQLLESEARLRKLIDGLGPNMFVGLTTPEGILLVANQPALAAAGIAIADVIGKPFAESYWFAGLEDAQRQLRLAIARAARGQSSRFDVQMRAIGKDKVWLDFSLQPLRDDTGQVAFLVPSAMVIDDRKRTEQRIHESEERFRQLTDNIRDVFWMTDPAKETILYVSPAYEAIWGRTCASLYADPHAWLDAVHPEDRGRVFHAVLSRQVAGTYDEEYRVVRPDGALRWIHERASVVRDSSGEVYRIAGVAEDVTERKLGESRLRESKARLEGLTRRMLEIQESERRAVARELHDEVGGALTAVKLNLQYLSRKRPGDDGDAALADGLALVEGAIQSVRSLSLDLRPAVLDDLGLVPALRWYCERQAQRAGIPIELALDAVDLKPFPHLESACFRIVQESVTNAMRHARARRMRVELRLDDGILGIEVSDDGCGFDVAAAQRNAAGRSGGLLGMAERAQLLSGCFAIDAAPGAGTRVTAQFAIPEEAPA